VQRSPRFMSHRRVGLATQFGALTVDMLKPDYFLVPSAKSLGTIPPTPLPNGTIDHYKCYRVSRARFSKSGVKVDDQFGTLSLDLTRPVRLCAAVDKNGEGVLDAAARLVCYKVRPLADPVPPGTVSVSNQFGEDTFGLFRPTELCVPAIET